MSAWIWGLILLPAVWAAHWGAEHLAEPVKKLRRRWGFTEAAGAALVGLAVASPEIGINTTSALRGVGTSAWARRWDQTCSRSRSSSRSHIS